MTLKYFIQQSDVGKGAYSGRIVTLPKCECCGRGEEKIHVDFAPLGRVMQCDVGKMMLRSPSGIWFVENQEQFEKRLSKL